MARKVSLIVNGRKMFFSKEELSEIVEGHFNRIGEKTEYPVEGKWFRVYPKAINQQLFKEKREDSSQEETRQLILEAFEKVKTYPEKYGQAFETTMPVKDWVVKNMLELKELANTQYKGHMADWVQQALEWAQRINNGETWETICNQVDKSNWYRVIVWKNTCGRLVGGGERLTDIAPCVIDHHDVYSHTVLSYTVPLVVRYI